MIDCSLEKDSPSQDYNHPHDVFLIKVVLILGSNHFLVEMFLVNSRETCKVSFKHVSSGRSIYICVDERACLPGESLFI